MRVSPASIPEAGVCAVWLLRTAVIQSSTARIRFASVGGACMSRAGAMS